MNRIRKKSEKEEKKENEKCCKYFSKDGRNIKILQTYG